MKVPDMLTTCLDAMSAAFLPTAAGKSEDFAGGTAFSDSTAEIPAEHPMMSLWVPSSDGQSIWILI